MKSRTITLYKAWLTTATQTQIDFVDDVYAICEKNYAAGGDIVVECYTPTDVLLEFNALEEVKEFCGLMDEQALNTRWGEDSDPEVKRMKRFEEVDWS